MVANVDQLHVTHVLGVSIEISENSDSWIRLLTHVYIQIPPLVINHVIHPFKFTLFSDRQKGLILAVQSVFVHCLHCFDVFHLSCNILKFIRDKYRIQFVDQTFKEKGKQLREIIITLSKSRNEEVEELRRLELEYFLLNWVSEVGECSDMEMERFEETENLKCHESETTAIIEEEEEEEVNDEKFEEVELPDEQNPCLFLKQDIDLKQKVVLLRNDLFKKENVYQQLIL